jgi:hypothetical protein
VGLTLTSYLAQVGLQQLCTFSEIGGKHRSVSLLA